MEQVVPVFFTVNNDEQGVRNPRSMLILKSLMKNGASAIILKSIDELECLPVAMALLGQDLPITKAVPIAVFDADLKVNHWSPQRNTMRSTPAWAHSAELGVRIGKRVLAMPTFVERCARQISTLFSRISLVSSEVNLFWGPAPKAKRRRRHEKKSKRHPGSVGIGCGYPYYI